MCVLYVNFACKVKPRRFGYVAMGSEALFLGADCSYIPQDLE